MPSGYDNCICISKVTKFKANNNLPVVFAATLIDCICISKVTKFKANNNPHKNIYHRL